MEHSERHRRALAASIVMGIAAALAPWSALALDAPSGQVILTVSGRLGQANERGNASFDLALLQTLPQHSLSTRTPWYPQPRRFHGVLLSDLLAAVGAPDAGTVNAVALNDYRVEIPVDDLHRNGAMLAYLLDGKPMAVRDKGPLLIIYPFDDKPELRDAVHYSRAIWQLRRLELR